VQRPRDRAGVAHEHPPEEVKEHGVVGPAAPPRARPRWLRARAAQAACELGRVEQRNGEGEDVPPAACKVPRLRAAQ